MDGLRHRVLHHHMAGTGMGSQLLGGAGSGSSYNGIADYTRTTGIVPRMGGSGLKRCNMNSLTSKLDKLESFLQHQNKKSKKGNIHFTL
jgi:hypothetical protein